MNIIYGRFTERELGDKLIKISDMEMDLYNHHRQLRIKLYYLAAVLCGLGFIPCWVSKFSGGVYYYPFVGLFYYNWADMSDFIGKEFMKI